MLCRETELLHRTLKLFGLPLKCRCRGGDLLHQRGVLLGHTVHLRNGNPDREMPLLCSSEADAICFMMVVTSVTSRRIASMVVPVSFTS